MAKHTVIHSNTGILLGNGKGHTQTHTLTHTNKQTWTNLKNYAA
jgi:hypothetical protein